MEWEGERESENVEDQRTVTPGRVAIGGAGIAIIALVTWLLGGDPRQVLQLLQNNPPQAGAQLNAGSCLALTAI